MKLYQGKIAYRLVIENQENVRFLFTGNATIKGSGALVMGRGAAREVRDLYPGVDVALGRAIREKALAPKSLPYYAYGLAWARLRQDPWPEIGVFQVKYHFQDQARLDLIEYAADCLGHLARNNPHMTYFMNYPGIGNGGLTRPAVEPILSSRLPDNVIIYI